jgi:hypothetical protein
VTQYEGNTQKFSSSGELCGLCHREVESVQRPATQEKVAQEQALHQRARLLHEDILQAAALEVEQACGLITSRKQVAVARKTSYRLRKFCA